MDAIIKWLIFAHWISKKFYKKNKNLIKTIFVAFLLCLKWHTIHEMTSNSYWDMGKIILNWKHFILILVEKNTKLQTCMIQIRSKYFTSINTNLVASIINSNHVVQTNLVYDKYGIDRIFIVEVNGRWGNFQCATNFLSVN
jgi:hypothetical protein